MNDREFRWTAAERGGQGGPTQDRHRLVRLEDGDLALLADGAGGLAGGGEAAELAVSRAEAWCRRSLPRDLVDLFELVKAVDRAVAVDPAAGLTTLALVLIRGDRILGLSAGNSEVWIHGGEAPSVLNGKRRYGPDMEIGTGMAMADAADLLRDGVRAVILWSDEAWSVASWEAVDGLTGDRSLEAARLLPPPGHDDDATVLLGVAP